LQPENESREYLRIKLCSSTGSTESETKRLETKRRVDVARCDHVVNSHSLDFAGRVSSLADGTNVHANTLFEIVEGPRSSNDQLSASENESSGLGMLRANNKGAETPGIVFAVQHTIAEALQRKTCVEFHCGDNVVNSGVHVAWNVSSRSGDLCLYLLF